MNAVDHNNVVIFDDRGIPSIMCRFVRPKDTEEVPAVFKIGDKVADAIYISKYPNIVIDGRAYSMPMADPTVNITFDGAVQACRCKGLGWHLMTAVEYEYLLNQSREKGTMPHGNTDWGKDYYHNDEQGKVSNLGRTYTGTGPVTWNHDHTPYGVSDLASVLGALTAIGAVAYKIIKWFQAQQKQTADIEDLKKQEKEDIKAMEDELCLLTYAVLACLKGLKEQGCNGPVTEAIGKIEKHINQKAHGQET